MTWWAWALEPDSKGVLPHSNRTRGAAIWGQRLSLRSTNHRPPFSNLRIKGLGIEHTGIPRLANYSRMDRGYPIQTAPGETISTHQPFTQRIHRRRTGTGERRGVPRTHVHRSRRRTRRLSERSSQNSMVSS